MREIVDILAADITGECCMTMQPAAERPTHDEIAQLAFTLYESRGRQDGHHVEDWLRAEEELVRHYA
jgi:hypothetical protein